ncbi:MAG: hypothetical protein SCARUB_01813 [Candidatus Scalindua rubra]|uniref:Uncharacterized protein n=1 Tax=Candidatus Scalindua rubra TaxID=1872076 RepID=A0A1E3XBN6_9BACT|nr:MAG: hypothetical protein SCARUB_01813 [Candidatus Scalindua rubra]
MHAAFPQINSEILSVICEGFRKAKLDKRLDRIAGTALANGMALALKLAFGFTMITSTWKSILNYISLGRLYKKDRDFLADNFEIFDPGVEGGKRYYQGKILFRTDKKGDDMNVLLKFCPEPENLYKNTIFGKFPDPDAIVSTSVLEEEEAERIENDPDKVDVVILFKDVKAIIGMIGKPDVDLVNLLLDNLMHVRGNVGHLFKFGSIATNIKLAFEL